MLKPIVQDDDPASQLLKRNPAHPVPVCPGQDGNAWKMPGQKVGFIGRRRGLTEQAPTIADDHRLRRTTPVPPQDDGDAVTPLV